MSFRFIPAVLLGTIFFVSSAAGRELPDWVFSTLIVSEIDSVCGDTWCEGDYDFNFRDLRCSPEGCVLDFVLMERQADDSEPVSVSMPGEGYVGTVARRSSSTVEFDAQCRLPGFTRLEQLASFERDTLQLKHEFYDVLTECIGAIEKQARGI